MRHIEKLPFTKKFSIFVLFSKKFCENRHSLPYEVIFSSSFHVLMKKECMFSIIVQFLNVSSCFPQALVLSTVSTSSTLLSYILP